MNCARWRNDLRMWYVEVYEKLFKAGEETEAVAREATERSKTAADMVKERKDKAPPSGHTITCAMQQSQQIECSLREHLMHIGPKPVPSSPNVKVS